MIFNFNDIESNMLYYFQGSLPLEFTIIDTLYNKPVLRVFLTESVELKSFISLQNEVRANVYLKRKLLSQTFDIIKVFSEGCFVVPKERWHAVMSRVMPDKSTTQIDILLYVLDENGDNKIGMCLNKNYFWIF